VKTQAHNETPQRKLVLVVDDFADARELYAMVLAGDGFAVAQAASADDALVEIARLEPELVVTDIVMPGRSGLDLCRLIRRDWPALPIIAVTARDLNHDERRTLTDMLCDLVLTKPCSPEALLRAVHRVLSARHSASQ
jgi:two-component system, cell cycle response regulator DivK